MVPLVRTGQRLPILLSMVPLSSVNTISHTLSCIPIHMYTDTPVVCTGLPLELHVPCLNLDLHVPCLEHKDQLIANLNLLVARFAVSKLQQIATIHSLPPAMHPEDIST